MVEKPYSGGLGDIANFPRKDSLQNDIERNVKERVEWNVTVRDIIIFGSWGRGTAIPFRSDIDIMVRVSNNQGDDHNIEYMEEMEKEADENMVNQISIGNYVLFDGHDIALLWAPDVFREARRNMTMRVQDKAYDLIRRERVELP